MSDTPLSPEATALLPRLRRILVDHLGVEESCVTPEAWLVDDLGADSLDQIELVMASEDAFGVQIADDEAAKCRTVQDVLSLLAAKGARPDAQAEG